MGDGSFYPSENHSRRNLKPSLYHKCSKKSKNEEQCLTQLFACVMIIQFLCTDFYYLHRVCTKPTILVSVIYCRCSSAGNTFALCKVVVVVSLILPHE